MFCFTGVNTAGWSTTRFGKYNFRTDTFTNLSLPTPGSTPVATAIYAGASIVWDGNDYLYLMVNNLTSLSRYTISTDTWTAMTAVGQAGNTTYSGLFSIYISRYSDIGLTKGWTADRIYYKPIHSTASSSGVYYYNVGANTWTLETAGSATNNPASTSVGATFVWDGKNRLHFASANATTYGIYNMITNSWSRPNNATTSTGTGYSPAILFLDSYQNQMVVDKTGTTYHMFGDRDHFKVALVHSNSTNWFYYFGNIDTFYSEQKVVTTSSISSGSNVSIPVSGVFNQFELNQPLYIYEPISGGKAERFTMTASGINTITAGTLSFSYGSGAKIGVDPQRTVSYINFWDAVHVAQSPYGPGCFTNNNSNPDKFGQEVTYSLLPGDALAMHSSFAGVRGHYQMMPVIVAGVPSETSNYPTGGTTPRYMRDQVQGKDSNIIGKFVEHYNNGNYNEMRGQLIGVYATKQTTAPEPVSGDEIIVGSNNYLSFKFENLFSSDGKNLLTILGPK